MKVIAVKYLKFELKFEIWIFLLESFDLIFFLPVRKLGPTVIFVMRRSIITMYFRTLLISSIKSMRLNFCVTYDAILRKKTSVMKYCIKLNSLYAIMIVIVYYIYINLSFAELFRIQCCTAYVTLITALCFNYTSLLHLFFCFF